MSVLIQKPNTAVVAVGSLLMLATLLMTQMPFAAAQRRPTLQLQMERGEAVYSQHCLACHQVNGAGVGGMNPPLIKTRWVLGDRTPLIQVLLKGMTGQMDINGDAYGNVMAPQSNLTDQQIADVLTYVRNSFGNKATAVTVAQVKAARAQLK